MNPINHLQWITVATVIAAAPLSIAVGATAQGDVSVTNSPGSIIAPSGGNNVINNGATAPQYSFYQPRAVTQMPNGLYQQNYFVEITELYAPPETVFYAAGGSVLSIQVVPTYPTVFGMIYTLGTGDLQGGGKWIAYQTPFHGKIPLSVMTTTPDRVDVGVKFDRLPDAP